MARLRFEGEPITPLGAGCTAGLAQSGAGRAAGLAGSSGANTAGLASTLGSSDAGDVESDDSQRVALIYARLLDGRSLQDVAAQFQLEPEEVVERLRHHHLPFQMREQARPDPDVEDSSVTAPANTIASGPKRSPHQYLVEAGERGVDDVAFRLYEAREMSGLHLNGNDFSQVARAFGYTEPAARELLQAFGFWIRDAAAPGHTDGTSVGDRSCANGTGPGVGQLGVGRVVDRSSGPHGGRHGLRCDSTPQQERAAIDRDVELRSGQGDWYRERRDAPPDLEGRLRAKRRALWRTEQHSEERARAWADARAAAEKDARASATAQAKADRRAAAEARRRDQLNARAQPMTEMYMHGATYQEIGERFGLTGERVRQQLKETGVEMTPRRERLRALYEQRADEVVEAFHELGDDRAVAQKLGLPLTGVQEIVRERVPAGQRRKPTKHRKKYAEQELVDCLREASAALGGVLSTETYNGYARDREFDDGRPWPGHQTPAGRFGSWRKALRAAGLAANPSSPVAGQTIFDEALCLDAVRHVGREVGGTPTAADYEEWARASSGGLPSLATVRNYCGGWNEALKNAGL